MQFFACVQGISSNIYLAILLLQVVKTADILGNRSAGESIRLVVIYSPRVPRSVQLRAIREVFYLIFKFGGCELVLLQIPILHTLEPPVQQWSNSSYNQHTNRTSSRFATQVACCFIVICS